ncbi:MAG: hypothetical protein NTW02_04870 [Cyanobium sp. LacPavin_0920_WC12_MAG_62_9]|nr:hypothetical protein [Cyanobium sp. LacPavin_0920_WC12_MAG_62_9]
MSWRQISGGDGAAGPPHHHLEIQAIQQGARNPFVFADGDLGHEALE